MWHLRYWCAVILCWARCGTAAGDLSDLTDDSVTHRQPPQLLESPSTPVCDPVKLRMLEDIDDSKPQSWTSQSRSFRKLSRLVGADSSEFP